MSIDSSLVLVVVVFHDSRHGLKSTHSEAVPLLVCIVYFKHGREITARNPLNAQFFCELCALRDSHVSNSSRSNLQIRHE